MRVRPGRLLVMLPLVLVAAGVFVFVGGTVVRLLWNWLLPPLFGWPQLGFWQALGLLALCRILFGGFGCFRSARSSAGQRMADRWAAMTPEERERFRQGFRGSWWHAPPEAKPGA